MCLTREPPVCPVIHRNLDDNAIVRIEAEAINQYSELTVLSLRNNKITSLRPRQFERLSKLRRL